MVRGSLDTLDLPAAEGLQRLTGKRDRMESKDLAFHRKVREGFLRQANEYPGHFAVVSASGSPQEVHRRLRKAIEDRWL